MARPSSHSPPQSDAPAHQDSPKEQLSCADPFREENSGINGEDRLSVGARHYGCAHYKRRCRIRAPCCNEIFDCRHCHNEIKNRNEKDPLKRHDVPRHLVQKVICSLCQHEQDVKQVCENCAVSMGDYFCSKCKFFDDETEKNQYHCDSCGICRIGGRENYFHCDRCANIMIDLSCHFRNSCSYAPGMHFCKWYLVNNDCDRPLGVCPTPCFTSSSFPGSCYTVALQNGHPCVEKSMHHNCPICFEYLFDSVMDISVLRCGHTMHKHCQTEMQKHHQFACPICSKSVKDMSMDWSELDLEIMLTPMPEEYQDKMVWILCNDCGGASEVRYHIVGQKCSTSTCGSYNTRSIRRPRTAN